MSHNKRRPGAPLGNQNARKHGYYSSIMDNNQLAIMHEMVAARGLDNEIAVMRTKIYSIIKREPDNFDLLLRALSLLNRMVRNQGQLSQRDLEAIRTLTRKYFPDELVPYSTNGNGDNIVSPN
jgi:uncharacterized protein YjcR